MITAYDFVHLVLMATRDQRIEGRTKLQKIVYFVGALTGYGDRLGYRAHYYGPYSSDVSVALDELRGLGFLTQRSASWGSFDSRGFEMARFDYELTDAGRIVAQDKAEKHSEVWKRIEAAVSRLAEAKAEDYVKLSVAAKSYYLQKEKRARMTPEERSQHTPEYGWVVTPEQFREADQLLETLRLSPT